MDIYNGTYSWDGKKHLDEDNVSWWPCSYYLQIVDISKIVFGTLILKPILCVFSNTGEGGSITNCTPNFVMRICSDFNLKYDKVMWVEHFPRYNNSFDIITLKKKAIGHKSIFAVKRRDAMDNELRYITRYYTYTLDEN